MRVARCLTLLTGALALVLPLSAQTWSTIPTASNPGGDTDPNISLAFDLQRGTVVKYGGRVASTLLDQTWTYNGSDWSLVTPATTNPGTRWGHRLVYDNRSNKVLMFGGRKVTAGTVTDEIWAWDGTDWALITPSTATTPGGRVWHNLALDSRRGRMVLYGGFGSLDTSTWEFDLDPTSATYKTWIQLTPTNRPPNVYDADMVYDASRGVCVLFGGFDGSISAYAGTWEWDGRDWRETFASNAAGAPAARYRHAMSYDLRRGVVILYGGYPPSQQQTWAYDGATWTLETVGGTPPPQPVQGGMTYDALRDRHVHYGGSGPPPGTSTTTSEYQSATRPSFAKAGEGCPGSNGIVALGAGMGSEARSGTTLVIEATGVPAASAAAALILGFSNVAAGPLPLPVELSFILLPNCWLDCSPDTSFPVAPVAGVATWSFALAPALNGLFFWTQALVLDPGAPNAGLATMTNACRAYVVP